MLKKLLPLLCLLLLLTGCGSVPAAPPAPADPEPWSTQIFAMDTVMDLTIYAPDDSLLKDGEKLVTDLENTLSTTSTRSDIHKLNRKGSLKLSEDTARLLDRALGFCDKTGGVLDLSIYPIVRAWGFTTDAYRVPEPQELEELLTHVDYTRIAFDAETGTATLPEAMEIDLGSVAKGYTSDRLAQLFRENGVTSALLNLGGNVQTVGSKPDGSPWKIGIQDPNSDTYMGVLAISDEAVITSGGYERFFTDDAGNVYWHIIDPATGYPAKNGLISATAVGTEGVYCDALSTSLFIMGPEKAAAFWRENRDFDMILITDGGTVLITPGLADRFTLVDGMPYTLQVLSES